MPGAERQTLWRTRPPPEHHLFDPLPPGRRLRSIKSQTSSLQNSFCPRAVREVNAAKHWPWLSVPRRRSGIRNKEKNFIQQKHRTIHPLKPSKVYSILIEHFTVFINVLAFCVTVCLFVCCLVGVFVSRLRKNVLNRFPRNLVKGWNKGQRKFLNIFTTSLILLYFSAMTIEVFLLYLNK